MAQKCVCGRDISEDKLYCFFCDPAISQEEKAEARKRGGANSKKAPHNLDARNYRPLTIESLRRLYSDLITECIENYDDTATLVKNLSRILPRASEIVAFDHMEFLSERLNQLEQRKSGKLLLPKVNDYVDVDAIKPED